jgi:hypothetical protein
MSDYTAIRDVTLQLRWVLFEGLSTTNIGNHHVDPQSISVFSPSDVISGNEAGLMSMFLFRIEPSSTSRNESPTGDHAAQVDLYYLLTPTSGEPDTDQLILGRTIQILEANQNLRGSSRMPNLSVNPVDARLTPSDLSFEASARIWDALDEPYRLSICYRVEGVTINAA